MEQALSYALNRPWEGLAVLLALAYVILAARKSIWCWPCALGTTAIYTLLFWQVNLPMESALNVYYLLMAVYGWWLWTKPGAHSLDGALLLRNWPLKTHLLAILAIAVLTLVSGWLLQTYRSSAAMPYLDSFTTWASVITTLMVARKIVENWLYWIVIDAAAIVLYLDRGMYMTAALFVLYVFIACYGWFSWRRAFEQQASA